LPILCFILTMQSNSGPKTTQGQRAGDPDGSLTLDCTGTHISAKPGEDHNTARFIPLCFQRGDNPEIGHIFTMIHQSITILVPTDRAHRSGDGGRDVQLNTRSNAKITFLASLRGHYFLKSPIL